MNFDQIILMNRYKTIGDEFLEHSEWIRKLRTPSLIGIASILTIPFGAFIITPHVVMNISGPSALISLLIAFVIMILSGMHMNELICSMPKSCLLYNFTYANFGEVPAFLVGWISLLDFTICIIIVAKNWSCHMNLLFRGLFDQYFTVEMPYHLDSVLTTKIDFFAILAIFFASIILCCNIRVMTTVSIIMVTICALTTNSTIFVGLYFADPNNWLTAGFFRHGINGVMKGASNYLCAYIGIETLSFLLEETKKPRKRLPFIVPFIIAASTVILFLTTMVITLVADITKYPDEMLFPSVFDKLRMPSAKYIMTIGSVCGLSGTMLAIFLPATRIIASLCGDNLLPLNLLAHTSKKRGVPYYAVLLCAFVSSSLIIFNTSKLFGIIAFNTPLRLILFGCLVYDQRYRPNVTGLFRETAFYHDIHRKRYKLQSSSNNFTDEKDSCSVTISRWSTDDENSILMSSYEIIRGILAEQEEAAHCQQLFEKLSSINEEVRLSLYDNNEEKISLLDKQCNALRNSQSLTENLKETMIKLCKNKKRSYHSSFDASDFGHNCARSPCSPPVSPTDFRGHNFHIFEHDIPDIPYYNRYTGSVQSSKSFNKNDYKRSMRILLLFILTSILIAFLAMKTENNLATLHLFLPTLAACIFLAYLTVATARQAINPENNERSCKIIAFPYLTLLTIFLAIFVTCTTDYGTIMEFIIWLVIGTIFYALYGYKHSKERCTTLNGLIISNTKKESSSTGIMNISNAESTGIML